MTLNDRVYYLAQSLASAKSAANLGAEDVDFTSNLQERLDVANVQMEVARAVEVHQDMSPEDKATALGQLNQELLGLDEVSAAGLGSTYQVFHLSSGRTGVRDLL